MFESAELGHHIGKAEFEALVPGLRADLLDAQYDLGQAKHFPVIILVEGIEGAGKSEAVNLLNAWMDPRHIRTHAFDQPSEEERERPFMWRYWRALPPKGEIGILFHNWYSAVMDQAVYGKEEGGRALTLDRRLGEINRLERMLAEEGALVLKFWFHLSRDEQKKRLKALEKNPRTRWRVTDDEWRQFKNYERWREAGEHVLRRTSVGHAPWIVVDGSDEHYRAITVGRLLLDAMKKRLEIEARGFHGRQNAAPIVPPLDQRNLLNALDLGLALPKKEYNAALEEWQGRFNQLVRSPAFAKRSLVIVFEGMDAAGKGSAIRRVTAALDARQYRIFPTAAPTEEERAQPYLWRFWRHVPRKGRVAIFDRSWYGRVLVERVEGFCSEAEWMRAFGEINDFEDQLAAAGAVVVKFWLHISQEEQMRRFKEREENRFKRFKITPEDWRNRERWPDYERAVCDMMDRTSTGHAPWCLVEGNDKNHARVKVLRELCQRLEQTL